MTEVEQTAQHVIESNSWNRGLRQHSKVSVSVQYVSQALGFETSKRNEKGYYNESRDTQKQPKGLTLSRH